MGTKVYLIRECHHYEGEQNILLTLDATTAHGFYKGYCDRLKVKEANSSYVSSQTDVELVAFPLDKELDWEEEVLIHKTLREIVGHNGIKHAR